MILGGITRIADVTQFLVPFMCLSYLLGAAVILVTHADRLPAVVETVLRLGLHRPRRASAASPGRE